MSFSHSVLLVGGTGYIGSHVAVALIENGAEVTILDDLSNSSLQVIDRIAAITGRTPRFVQGDMRDPSALDACFSARRIDCVILLAGLKSVPQSLADPLTYYDVNIGGAIAILSAMQRHGCQNIVFSSSATVYGTPRALPIREDHPLAPTNPYGETKAMIERILLDHATARAESGFRQISLRYFNPVGAHASGLIGEAPRSSGGNLFPMLAEATQSSEREFRIFGTDLATPDGTAERDFIHVCDLAEGHVRACSALAQGTLEGVAALNLGTGRAHSVAEAVGLWQSHSGIALNVQARDRRGGDVERCWADPTLAENLLGWKATRDLDEMCRSHWNFVHNGKRSAWA